MKNILYLILSLLLCAILAGGVFIVTQGGEDVPDTTQSESVTDSFEEEDSENASTGKPDSGTTDSGGNNDEDSGGNNGGDTVVDTSLKDPVNVSAYIADGMEMMSGASVYTGNDEIVGPAMRFTCLVETAVAEEVMADEDKSMGILLAPLEYFDEVNVNNYTYIDWMTEFEKAGKTVIFNEFDDYGTYDSDTSYIRFTLAKVMYKNVNRRFAAIGVIKDNSGATPTYKYSAFADGNNYRTNARSIAYVTAAALNAHTLGMENFTNEELTILKGYINQSVDFANGKAEATNDGSMYAFTVKPAGPKTLSVGEYFTLETTISPNVNVPVWYRSSDESIVEVDDKGVVTAKAKGTAVIGVYVAGETIGVTVTVS
jgi:hypothetical protein